MEERVLMHAAIKFLGGRKGEFPPQAALSGNPYPVPNAECAPGNPNLT